MKSKLVKHQTKRITKDIVLHDGTEGTIIIDIRYDDECNNGHNSFGVTGALYSSRTLKSDSYSIACGCIHKDIEKYVPELSHLIKWHMFTSTGPMYYIENTLYHAKDREDMTLPVGAATAYATALKFRNIPFTFPQQIKGFWEYLNSIKDFNAVNVEAVPYDGTDDYAYTDTYSLTGFFKKGDVNQWHTAPFKELQQAREFLECLQTYDFSYCQIPTKFNKLCTPNLEYARKSAVWPDATLEQLQDIKQLNIRLPELLAEFKVVVESLGFTF